MSFFHNLSFHIISLYLQKLVNEFDSPNRLPYKPTTAVSSITLKSHKSASSKPPATAYPLRAAIIGFLNLILDCN